MKFTTVVLGLFVAIAAAVPAPQPQEVSADAKADVKLEARQNCGACYGGTRNCCGPGGCMLFKC
ncbi:hypothetical protein ACRALDRAFT_1078114 [Sodiomyces alcalophilus JCM 7366]|uniref:uncharacterized protein n=1 Tax=Sodiomyces alcalophilus JCM 7366 TaxID=591952 RepID=UPI0039B47DC1